MAKKILVEDTHDKEKLLVKKYIDDNDEMFDNFDNKDFSNKTSGKKWIIILFVIILGLVTALILLVINNNKLNKENESLSKEVTKLENESFDNMLNNISNKTKLKFFDEQIVFVIEGFGDYYYSYDCMIEKVDGNYSFWAYNINQAISRGYKQGTC